MYKLIQENKELEEMLEEAKRVIDILDSKIVLHSLKREFGVDEKEICELLNKKQRDRQDHNEWHKCAKEIYMRKNNSDFDVSVEIGKMIGSNPTKGLKAK